MTIRKKLTVLAECENRNKFAIAKYLDRSPIYKRSDPRYKLKLKVRRIRNIVDEYAPEVVFLTIAECVGIAVMPFILLMLFGGV